MKMRTAIIIINVLMLAACGSSPKTNYFVLTPAQESASQPHLAFPVQIAAVHIPPSLDRQEMVRMSKGEAVEISDADRWSAPMNDMVRNVLSQDLQSRLPRNKVILPDAPAPKGTRSLVVSIAFFGAESDGRVTLSGSWSLLGEKGDTPLFHRDVDLHAQGGSSAGEVAAGMSHALGDLASDMADTLGNMRS